MRIAIVGTELCAVDARGGGLEHVLRRWAIVVAERHEVVVVSHRRGGRDLSPEPAPYTIVPIDRTTDLGAALRHIKPDVVSFHNRPGWGAVAPAEARVGVTFHNYPGAWKWNGRHLRVDASYSAVSGALAVAASARLGVQPGVVARTPPSIDSAFCAPPRRVARPIVLFPNRLMRKKGVTSLLDVAARPEFEGMKFLFADLISPWLRPTAEHRALRAAVGAVANAELFAPARDPNALAARYAEAAVVACPVVEPEGLGLVPLEAQACGAPVVTTDLGGLREATFAPNECISPGDPDALAAALLAATQRPFVEQPRLEVLARHAPAAAGAVYERWLTAL